jgi:phosphoribosylaminoimidazole-succinocarboxamide synthase
MIVHDYSKQITAALDSCITETKYPGKKHIGKVRDTYDQDDKLLIVSTDRLSAFDRFIAAIPFKGQVLNQISAWWFKQTKHIIDNHVIEVPKPNITIAKKCKVFPVEFIVRAYVTGTTSTSLWTHYEKGEREYCGYKLPDGLIKNQPLPKPILTPTTKEAIHDRPLSAQDILKQELMRKQDWEYVSKIALQLFNFGSQLAAKCGLILVDTKYEFGEDKDGNILLVDELHTPDSSRYWRASNYQVRFVNNQEPDNFDKEILRLWYKKHCDPYKDKVLPPAPKELIIKLAQRYIQLYEMITGNKFKPY